MRIDLTKTWLKEGDIMNKNNFRKPVKKFKGFQNTKEDSVKRKFSTRKNRRKKSANE